MKSILILLATGLVVCCSDDKNAPESDREVDTVIDTETETEIDPDAGPSDNIKMPPQPMCVYNQAYQENWQADSISLILNNAKNCYVLVDPFADKEDTTVTKAIPALQANGNVVGCYISSGTCENWRADFDEMKPHCVTIPWGEWEGEYFIDQPRDNTALLSIMYARIDKMAAWGCDMVEFDNMDWAFDDDYRTEYGFGATASDGINYNNALCDYTHSQGMRCMAKNTRQGAARFDGGTFESYDNDKDWWEHDHLQGFLDAGQPGIIVHYHEGNCSNIYENYQNAYSNSLSFICESSDTKAYVHFNEDNS